MSEPTEAMRLEKFLEVVRKIPPTWTCMACNGEFDNGPYGEPPEAFKTSWDKRGKRHIVGHICRRCFYGAG